MKAVRFRFVRELAVTPRFAYEWYTDVAEDDTGRARFLRYRKILARGPDFVELEEEAEFVGRRIRARTRLTKLPPDRWRVEATATHGTATADYHLEPSGQGCRLVIESEWRFTSWVRFFVPFFRRRLTRELGTEVDDFAASVQKDFAAKPLFPEP